MGALTDIQIKRWIKEKTPVAKADGEGLTFTLSASGRAAWILRYRIAGKAKERAENGTVKLAGLLFHLLSLSHIRLIERESMKKSSQLDEVTEQGTIPQENCTRVTSNVHGLKTYMTFRDHEAEKLADYIAQEEAGGAIVTTERGVWTI